MVWFRDFQGMRDLGAIWDWLVDWYFYYWSVSPVVTVIVSFIIAVVILTGTARFKLFGNSLLSIVTTVITSTITFIFQTVLKTGGSLVWRVIISSYHRLVGSKN